MSIMVAELLTRADLDAMPDDGRRYELVDGSLLVTPSPGLSHQDVTFRLATVLDHATRGTDWHMVMGPFYVPLSLHTVLVPDIVVAPHSNFTERGVRVQPSLIVEVRSRSTARFDATLKRDLYADAGVPHYWLVDPVAPAISVLELVDGSFVQRARATDAEPLTISHPFPVQLTPTDLLV